MNKLFICIFVYIIGNLILTSNGNIFADTLKTDTHKSGQKVAKATFAGGCFWCMQHPYDKLEGVISTTVGYTGGSEKNPTYKEVSAGKTGHAEAIEITYDPLKITYSQLLDVFWRYQYLGGTLNGSDPVDSRCCRRTLAGYIPLDTPR